MSSSGDPNSSHYNDGSPPLYPSTDRFNPLGFSTPQQRGNSSAHARNYYSVQPKHMLPRARGFRGRNRYGQQDSQDQDRPRFAPQESNTGDHGGRSWRGHQNRNQHFGHRPQQNFRQKHQARDAPCNIRDYFHPSMLEDPWEFLQRKNESFGNQSRKAALSRNAENDDVGSNSDGGSS